MKKLLKWSLSFLFVFSCVCLPASKVNAEEQETITLPNSGVQVVVGEDYYNEETGERIIWHENDNARANSCKTFEFWINSTIESKFTLPGDMAWIQVNSLNYTNANYQSVSVNGGGRVQIGIYKDNAWLPPFVSYTFNAPCGYIVGYLGSGFSAGAGYVFRAVNVDSIPAGAYYVHGSGSVLSA